MSRAERMDGIRSHISPEDLYKTIGTASAPLVVDVRRPEDFDAADRQIAGAIRRLPTEVDQWRREIPDGRRGGVYWVPGTQVSHGVAAALAAAAVDASYVEGGFPAWRQRAFP